MSTLLDEILRGVIITGTIAGGSCSTHKQGCGCPSCGGKPSAAAGGHKNWRERRRSRLVGGAKPAKPAGTSRAAELEYELEAPMRVSRPQVILVAGHNWHGPTHRMVEYCKNRAQRLFRKDKTLRFTIFDFTSGETLEGKLEKGKLKFTTISQRKAITPAHYRVSGDKYVFKGDPGVLSITDVYKKIISIGATEPGTLKELYFAGHGWLGGPALVNSYDRVRSSLKRDPADKDPRLRKDFVPPNMTRRQLTNFRRAYAFEGFSWVAGCSFPRPVYQLLHRMFKNKIFAKGFPTVIPDAFEFTFSYTSDQAEKWYKDFPTIYPRRNPDGSYPKTFKRNWGQLKAFLSSVLDKTYARAISKASGKPCRSAFPGTYADYQPTGVLFRQQIIPRDKAVYGINFRPYINFYKTYFNMKEDPEGFGYGVFEP